MTLVHTLCCQMSPDFDSPVETKTDDCKPKFQSGIPGIQQPSSTSGNCGVCLRCAMAVIFKPGSDVFIKGMGGTICVKDDRLGTRIVLRGAGSFGFWFLPQ